MNLKFAVAAAFVLTPGNYMAHVMPPFNHAVANQIEKTLKKTPGIDSVSADTEDSSIHFTVKKNARPDVTQLNQALDHVQGGAVMTTPILENSFSANTGL